MSSADRVAHIDGQPMQLLYNTHALPAEYKCLYENRAIHLRMFAGFLFTNIFCAATNFGCIDSFLLPNSRNEEMMGDVVSFWCYCCRFVLNSKRLLSTSCNKQGPVAASSIFFIVIPRCFLKFAESYVKEN